MKKRETITIQLDPQGHLILPPDLMQRYGIRDGATVRLDEDSTGITISRSSANLAKIYIELTNQCNLTCATCMRNSWNEPAGWISEATFNRILADALKLNPPPTIFFGGFGEPLAHPRFLEMAEKVKRAGLYLEVITNGILLDKSVSSRLRALRVDRLWVSIDGATPESYADIRLGAELPKVLANLSVLYQERGSIRRRPRLGIAFVAMKRNIQDLPEVIRLGKRLGADQFSISNLLPHSEEMRGEILYRGSLYSPDMMPSSWSPMLSLPRMDFSSLDASTLAAALRDIHSLTVTRQDLTFGINTCPFVEKASLSIRWDGEVSPCLALLHDHIHYLDDTRREIHACTYGNINEQTLIDIWNNPAYVSLREKLVSHDFSPCTFCNSCQMAESNLEDCFGNQHPTCGGCLWAQGFIQCP